MQPCNVKLTQMFKKCKSLNLSAHRKDCCFADALYSVCVCVSWDVSAAAETACWEAAPQFLCTLLLSNVCVWRQWTYTLFVCCILVSFYITDALRAWAELHCEPACWVSWRISLLVLLGYITTTVTLARLRWYSIPLSVFNLIWINSITLSFTLSSTLSLIYAASLFHSVPPICF